MLATIVTALFPLWWHSQTSYALCKCQNLKRWTHWHFPGNKVKNRWGYQQSEWKRTWLETVLKLCFTEILMCWQIFPRLPILKEKLNWGPAGSPKLVCEVRICSPWRLLINRKQWWVSYYRPSLRIHDWLVPLWERRNKKMLSFTRQTPLSNSLLSLQIWHPPTTEQTSVQLQVHMNKSGFLYCGNDAIAWQSWDIDTSSYTLPVGLPSCWPSMALRTLTPSGVRWPDGDRADCEGMTEVTHIWSYRNQILHVQLHWPVVHNYVWLLF